MRKRALAVLAVLGLVLSTVATAAAANQQLQQSRRQRALDKDTQIENSLEADRELLRADARNRRYMRHEGQHLPARKNNIKLLGRTQLTNVNGGVADVHYYKGYAYVAKWAPECPQGGVDVVNVKDPRHPHKVGFIPAGPADYVGEGVHAMHLENRYFRGDILLVNHEGCAPGAQEGISLWDITNPRAPEPLALHTGDFDVDFGPPFGDITFPTANSVHSVMGVGMCTARARERLGENRCNDHRRGFAVLVDNYEPGTKDVDIMNITNPRAPRMIFEGGLPDWPGVEVDGNGKTSFHHDMWVNAHRPDNVLALSYWDAGWIFLDITSPKNPTFIKDTNYPENDLMGFSPPEGNAHQGEWNKTGKWWMGADEDFAPFRSKFEILTGPNAGVYEGAEFGWTIPIAQNFEGDKAEGRVVWGGSGCPGQTASGNPAIEDRAEVPEANTFDWAPGEEKILILERGGTPPCFFSEKVETGQIKGYDMVIITNHHAGAEGGNSPDAYICGSMGHEFDVQISGGCTGHRAQHNMFDDPPQYTPVAAGNEGDMPLPGIRDEDPVRFTSQFDGWGYLNQYNYPRNRWKDAYAAGPTLARNRAFGYGVMSIHEIETDRRRVNLGYIAWYAVGMKVVKFGRDGIKSRGTWREEAGNDFWGVAIQKRGQKRPIFYGSDRDYGLMVFKYTGPE